MSYKDDMMIFALNSNVPLAQKIADRVGIPLSKSSVERFSDGEIQINIDETVRGKDVYLVQSTSDPVNDSLMELLIMIDAVRRASARTINIVMPYYGYARQDRKTRAREPITAKLVADMLQTAGADRILSLDLHAPQIQGFFDIPVVVSPDHGGVNRARKLAEFLGCPIAIVDKRRPKANVAEVMNIIGDVKGKRAIIIDDMIDTAGTITLAAQALIDAGATEVYASATHAVLSGPAIKRLNDSPIKNLILTDSINQPAEKKLDKMLLVSVGPLMGDAIKCIQEHKALSPLFDNRYEADKNK